MLWTMDDVFGMAKALCLPAMKGDGTMSKRIGWTVDIEQVHERAFASDSDDALDFYSAAIALGASKAEAERIDEYLTTRVMVARGAI